MRVRMAGGWPVGVSGNKNHPVTKGALCPLAFAAQQLNWHPQRLREVRHRERAASWSAALTAFARACGEGPVVVIDGRQGRAASRVLEEFARKQKGSYQVALSAEGKALQPYAKWSGLAVAALGYDLENVKTIASFGAPLLDGWGTPGRFTKLWSERAAGRDDPKVRLIQVEASLSRTAARAWKWIPIREGSEGAAAAGIADVLFEEKLVKAQGPVPQMSLTEAAEQTGLSIEAIRGLARTLAESQPALAIAADGNTSIAALNVVLGDVGAPGGVVRNQTARPQVLADPPITAPRAALIDSSVPWEFTPPAGAEVFRFAAWDGGGSNADWLLRRKRG
jgi:anaerobic selenocysteine-containing dehydrogenase